MWTANSYRDILKAEYCKRVQVNRAYSLRAFARDLQVIPSRLSQIFSGQLGMSAKAAEQISARLGFGPEEKEYFCLLVQIEHGKTSIQRHLASEKLEVFKGKWPELDLQTLTLVSSWYHFAILELTHLKSFQANHEWIAKKINISTTESKMAVERLIATGLLKIDQDGRWIDTNGDLKTTHDIPSRVIRDLHHQLIEISKGQLELVPMELRDYGALIVSFPQDKVAEAKNILRNARRALNELSKNCENPDSVYCAQMNFFPLDKIHKEEKIQKNQTNKLNEQAVSL